MLKLNETYDHENYVKCKTKILIVECLTNTSFYLLVDAALHHKKVLHFCISLCISLLLFFHC